MVPTQSRLEGWGASSDWFAYREAAGGRIESRSASTNEVAVFLPWPPTRPSFCAETNSGDAATGPDGVPAWPSSSSSRRLGPIDMESATVCVYSCHALESGRTHVSEWTLVFPKERKQAQYQVHRLKR